MQSSLPGDRSLGFFDGLIDGLFARRFWDPERAAVVKSPEYVLGELWAVSTQPLALLAAILDYERMRDEHAV